MATLDARLARLEHASKHIVLLALQDFRDNEHFTVSGLPGREGERVPMTAAELDALEVPGAQLLKILYIIPEGNHEHE